MFVMPEKKSIPADPALTTGAERHYFDLLENGSFMIQRCCGCNKAVFFPRMICPHCGADELEWFAPSGRGAVYSTTVVRRKPEHGGDYNVALIDLEEGVRMMSRVEGVTPESVFIGMSVLARIADSENGKLVVFDAMGEKQ